jgi:hypothetical protein
MKKLFLILTMILLSLPVLADSTAGSTLCAEDKTTLNELENLSQEAINQGKCIQDGALVECPDGKVPGEVISN